MGVTNLTCGGCHGDCLLGRGEMCQPCCGCLWAGSTRGRAMGFQVTLLANVDEICVAIPLISKLQHFESTDFTRFLIDDTPVTAEE